MCLGMGYAIVPKKGSLHQPTVGFVPPEWHLSANLQVWMSEKLTIPETNIAPENRPPQRETSIPTIHFQVLC